MKGYTCCIDLKELGETVEALSSIDSCISNNSLINIFYDIDNVIKKENFEHGNCFSTFSNLFEYITSEIEVYNKDIFQLNYAIQKTIIMSKQTDSKTPKDLQEISEYYGDEPAKNTGQTLFMNPTVVLADNKDVFEKEMDPFIRALTDAPTIEDENLPYVIQNVNNLPLGLSIALTGDAYLAGAAMIHSIRNTKKDKKGFYSSLEDYKNIDKNIWDDPVPFYAKKDLDEKKDLYPANFDVLEKMDAFQ